MNAAAFNRVNTVTDALIEIPDSIVVQKNSTRGLT